MRRADIIVDSPRITPGTSFQADIPNTSLTFAATRRALRENRIAAATQSAAALLGTNSDFKKLARIFAEAQQIEPLVQLIWDRREAVLNRFSAIATFLQLCNCLDEARVREFRLWLFADSTSPANFWFSDFLHLLKDF